MVRSRKIPRKAPKFLMLGSLWLRVMTSLALPPWMAKTMPRLRPRTREVSRARSLGCSRLPPMSKVDLLRRPWVLTTTSWMIHRMISAPRMIRMVVATRARRVRTAPATNPNPTTKCPRRTLRGAI